MKSIFKEKKFYIISVFIVLFIVLSGLYVYDRISIIGNFSILEKKIITNYSKEKFIRKIVVSEDVCNKTKLDKYIKDNFGNFVKIDLSLSDSIKKFVALYKESNTTLTHLKNKKAISERDYLRLNSNLNKLDLAKIDSLILQKSDNSILAEKSYFDGLIFQLKFDYKGAEKAYLEAINLNSDNLKYYYALGNVYYGKYEFSKAIDAFENGLSTSNFNNRKEKSLKFALLFDLASTYMTVNDLDKAYEVYSHIFVIARDYNDMKYEYLSVYNLAQIEMKRGNYEIAINYLKYSLKLASKLNDNKYKAQALNSLSGVYYKYGDYNNGKKNGLKAIKLAKRTLSLNLIAQASLNVCLNYEYLNNTDLAIAYCKQSLGINDVLSNVLERPEYAIKNGFISSFVASVRSYENSLSYYTKAYDMSKQNDLRLLEIESMYGLSDSNNMLGDRVKALKYLDDAINFREKLGIMKEVCDFCKYGVIYWNKKDYKKAISYYETGLDIARKSNNKIAIACSTSHLASINFELKKYKVALDYSNLALNTDKKMYTCGHHYIKYQLDWNNRITKEMENKKK